MASRDHLIIHSHLSQGRVRQCDVHAEGSISHQSCHMKNVELFELEFSQITCHQPVRTSIVKYVHTTPLTNMVCEGVYLAAD